MQYKCIVVRGLWVCCWALDGWLFNQNNSWLGRGENQSYFLMRHSNLVQFFEKKESEMSWWFSW